MCFSLLAVALLMTPPADEARIKVDAGRIIHRISPYLAGACIEDVNHEIYGGLYSQMIFGESFGEPPAPVPIRGYATIGGRWQVVGDEVRAGASDGPKLVLEGPPVGDGEVAVDLLFPTGQGGNSGLIVRVDRPEVGADAWSGYEISLETAGRLVIGRHRRNWEPILTVPCAVPVNEWIHLAVRMEGSTLEAIVNGKSLAKYDDREHPLGPGRVGMRDWQRPVHFRNFQVTSRGSVRKFPFEAEPGNDLDTSVSGMWRGVQHGLVQGKLSIETDRPFKGRQSQRITFAEGSGDLGIENRGLNRWGMNFEAGKPYEGVIWLRAEGATPVTLALETGDGGDTLASTVIRNPGTDWTRHEFALTPTEPARAGRFVVKLDRPGSVVVGYASLQPGDWGRYKGMPVRKDVAEGLINQGVSILRYGGSMVNDPEYLWKQMIGPRDRRPQYRGTWYPYSTNGWGIVDFLDFTEALGIPGIPAFFMGETPQDMADFIEYANGPASSPWGQKRADAGHPAPYNLKHIELGNEEKIDAAYWAKFEPMAEAIWARDPAIIVVVGDFAYQKVITNADHFEGGAGSTTLRFHQKILELARQRHREVWFDIHISTDHPPQPDGLLPERSFIDQLGKLAPGANFRVPIFEYNSGNHRQKRALSNALATNEVERIGPMVPVACVANCLQPDGQNDNGWDQGMLFLNPAQVWLQPPGTLVQLLRTFYQPLLVGCDVTGPTATLSVNAKRSDDGKTLVLQVVNTAATPQPSRIDLASFTPTKSIALIEQLAGPLDARNTASAPTQITPTRSEWTHKLDAGPATYTFAAHSITMIRFD